MLASFTLRSLVSTTPLSQTQLEGLLLQGHQFRQQGLGPLSPAPLHGATVATVFAEASTRTRCSFELAAKHLGATVLDVPVERSSLQKGETLEDTLEALVSMGVHAVVLRHSEDGLPAQLAQQFEGQLAVLNAGDGKHEHPTQGLLDALTLMRYWGDTPAAMAGKHLVLVGDVAHSRVVGSALRVLSRLGLKLTAVGPAELLPPAGVQAEWSQRFGVAWSHQLNELLPQADAVMALRLQKERMPQGLLNTLPAIIASYQLHTARWEALAKPTAVLLHPGPVNYGWELEAALAKNPRYSLINEQVTNGVAVRMAALLHCLAPA
jgi:aspartate carbamoyltransferase catalytic subunit